MKNFFLLGLVLMSLNVKGQRTTQHDKLFLDLHAGARIGGENSRLSKGLPGMHIDAGIGYMLSPVWGLKGSLGYDQLNATLTSDGVTIDDQSFAIRANLEVVANLSVDKSIDQPNMNYLFHFGLGMASQFHSSYKDSLANSGTQFSDPLIKGNDDMLSIILGFTPQFKLSNSIYLDTDLSLVFLPLSDGVYDKLIDARQGKSMNVFLNTSIGLSIHL